MITEDSSSEEDETERRDALGKLKQKIAAAAIRARKPTKEQLEQTLRYEAEVGAEAEAKALHHSVGPTFTGRSLPTALLLQVVAESISQQMPPGVAEELRTQGFKCVKLPEVARSRVEALLELGNALFESEPAVKATMTVREGDGAGHLAEGDLGFRMAGSDMFLDTRFRGPLLIPGIPFQNIVENIVENIIENKFVNRLLMTIKRVALNGNLCYVIKQGICIVLLFFR